MTNNIEDFIKRRFPEDCNWLSGNCYHFSSILASVFPGDIYYDVTWGHFLFRYAKDGYYYDWSGKVTDYGFLVKWESFDDYDSMQKKIIIRDCVL